MTDEELKEILGGVRTPTAQALRRLLQWAWAHKGYLPYISTEQLARVGGILRKPGPKPKQEKAPKKVYRKTEQRRRGPSDPTLLAEKTAAMRRHYARGNGEGYPATTQPDDPLTWRAFDGKVYCYVSTKQKQEVL